MSMTHEEAARILDPETSREALDEIEYYGGFRGDEAVLEAVNEACRIAAEVLRNKQTGEALTMEQLRDMDGQPVWVKVLYGTDIRCDGWCEVEVKYKNTSDEIAYVWWPGSEVEDIGKIKDYGKTWLAYAYPPAHINRKAWKCEFCERFNFNGARTETDKYGARILLAGGVSAFPSNVTFKHCPECGRPLTPEAWAMLEKRLGG